MRTEFRQGEHICSLYDTEDEQIAVAVGFLADGLRRGERCVYAAASPAALGRFRVALAKAGIDVRDMTKSMALVQLTHAEAHLVDGHFDCERMLRFLNETVEQALREGFSALRTCGDMSWLLKAAPGSDQVIEYESFLSGFFRGVPAAGMCQYDRQRMAGPWIAHAVHTHTSTISPGL